MRYLHPAALWVLVVCGLAACQPDAPNAPASDKTTPAPTDKDVTPPTEADKQAPPGPANPLERLEQTKTVEQIIAEDRARDEKDEKQREASPESILTKLEFILPEKDGDPFIINNNIYLYDGRIPNLMWVNNPTSYKLYERPDEKSKVVGLLKLGTEENIAWKNMSLRIYKPRPFVAKNDLELTHPQQRAFDIKHRFGYGELKEKIAIKAKDVYEVYYAFGNGLCFAKVQGQFYFAACPEPTQFTCEFVPRDYSSAPMQPLDQLMWFEVEHPSAKGWLPYERTEISMGLKHLDWETGQVEKKSDSPPPEIDYTKLPQNMQPPADAKLPKPKPIQITKPATP